MINLLNYLLLYYNLLIRNYAKFFHNYEIIYLHKLQLDYLFIHLLLKIHLFITYLLGLVISISVYKL